ncbi:uncharacterized protein LOC142175943 [Nicotiana tabacum]|uniref:Uncharacterized protein LOC142175943 n=1 Tax=Nicotiana tabacum TaxID=4097 RepID=A0AC58TPA2_TOBAC
MQREYGFFVITLMDPFQNQRLIQNYRRRLGMEVAISNINGKIWLFLDVVVQWDVRYGITLGGCRDFNVILNEEEKISGLLVYLPEYEDFTFCVNSCDMGYKGSPFTWWNGRPNSECIFKRLDKFFVNVPFQTLFPNTKVEHHIRTGSDHAPLLMSCEVLSRSLNKLFKDQRFKGFGMPKWTDPLNHLAYADDTIIFASADPYSLEKIIEVLYKYEHISGQMINKTKSSFYLHSTVSARLFNSVGAITGFSRGKATLLEREVTVLWGEITLITSVLQSMPTHILSVLDPPNNVLEHLHKTFARFFWSNKDEGRSRHWTKWQNLCIPKEEGGVGFRSLHDVSRALFAKLWGKFRTSKSLWSNFMWNKYCKKELPIVVKFRGGSHVRRRMLEAREEVDHEILWEMKRGSTNVWHENWTGLRALYHVVLRDYPINEDIQEVTDLRVDDAWDEKLLDQSFPIDIAQHIRHEVLFDTTDDGWDFPRWMPTPSGNVSISSAYNLHIIVRCGLKVYHLKSPSFYGDCEKGRFPQMTCGGEVGI